MRTGWCQGLGQPAVREEPLCAAPCMLWGSPEAVETPTGASHRSGRPRTGETVTERVWAQHPASQESPPSKPVSLEEMDALVRAVNFYLITTEETPPPCLPSRKNLLTENLTTMNSAIQRAPRTPCASSSDSAHRLCDAHRGPHHRHRHRPTVLARK